MACFACAALPEMMRYLLRSGTVEKKLPTATSEFARDVLQKDFGFDKFQTRLSPGTRMIASLHAGSEQWVPMATSSLENVLKKLNNGDYRA